MTRRIRSSSTSQTFSCRQATGRDGICRSCASFAWVGILEIERGIKIAFRVFFMMPEQQWYQVDSREVPKRMDDDANGIQSFK